MEQKPVSESASVTGQTEEHLVRDPESDFLLHAQMLEPFKTLRTAARREGFDLAIASSFRSFARQRAIWNEKAGGQRAVLDDGGGRLDLSSLNDWQKVCAILRWSALPGASRHHWGTDLDVFDRGGLSTEYPKPELTAAECEQGGVFHRFHQWLDSQLTRDDCDFFRPYGVDRGGVGCEPWHISYRPVSERYQQALTLERLETAIANSDIALRDTVLAHLDHIYQRFVVVPA